MKWDGFRALIEAAPSGIKIWSRNGHDMTARYPELQGLKAAVTTPVVLDGEIVCLDDKGNPDFAVLWNRNRRSTVLTSFRTSSVGESQSLCYMIFDLLEIDGECLLDAPYSERRNRLEELDLSGPHWCTPEIHIGEGAALFAATKKMGLEGVVAKRLDSRYRPGLRSKSWTKTKHFQTRNFALLGWLPPQEWRQDRGCVVLGLPSEAGIAVAGVVESGYGRELVEQLRFSPGESFGGCNNQAAFGKARSQRSERSSTWSGARREGCGTQLSCERKEGRSWSRFVSGVDSDPCSGAVRDVHRRRTNGVRDNGPSLSGPLVSRICRRGRSAERKRGGPTADGTLLEVEVKSVAYIVCDAVGLDPSGYQLRLRWPVGPVATPN